MSCSLFDNILSDSTNLTPYEKQKKAMDAYYANPVNIIEPFALTPFWMRVLFVIVSLVIALALIYFVINYTPIGGQKIIEFNYPTFTSSDMTGLSELPSYIK